MEAAWRRRGRCVEAAEATLRRRGGGMGAAWRLYGVWGLHLNRRNGRRMYLSYFLLVDVLVFVLVDERLIWYSCMYLVMSLLQHLFVPL